MDATFSAPAFVLVSYVQVLERFLIVFRYIINCEALVMLSASVALGTESESRVLTAHELVHLRAAAIFVFIYILLSADVV